MQTLIRTTSDNHDFQNLVALLDADLRVRDGEDHAFYAQFNSIDSLKHAIVYYLDGLPVGCGSFKKYDVATVEVKRMFVDPEFRRKAIGAAILKELEKWAAELHYESCILETGKKQPEAVELYKRSGYEIIDNYGQYKNVENSVCMKKMLK